MSETAKVRLVRCPKCANLLPEVTDFSVYQCGGCGVVLRGNSLCASLCVYFPRVYIMMFMLLRNLWISGGADLCFCLFFYWI